MTNFRISVIASVIAVSVVFSIYFFDLDAKKETWIIGSGEKGGNYDAVAHALADYLKRSRGWEVIIKNSSGSGENLELLKQGKVDLCLVQNDFPGNEQTKALASLYDECLHVIVSRQNSSLEDFLGGTISVGQKGGGTEALAKAMIKKLGVRDESVTWRNESLKEGLGSLLSGTSIAVCVVTGIGNSVITEAFREGNFSLLPLGELPGEVLAYNYPFVETAIIPQRVYSRAPGKGLPEKSLPTVGTRVVLACNSNLNETDTLEITRTLMEGRAALTKAHPLLARMVSPINSNKLQFPLHEGARQYYERDEPTFIQNWSDPIALLVSLLVIAWGIGVTLRELFLRRSKESLDVYFEQVDEITSELVKGTKPERIQAIVSDLHEIRRQTTRKLMAEELTANESFVIFQRQLHTAQQMVNEFIRKNENSSTKG